MNRVELVQLDNTTDGLHRLLHPAVYKRLAESFDVTGERVYVHISDPAIAGLSLGTRHCRFPWSQSDGLLPPRRRKHRNSGVFRGYLCATRRGTQHWRAGNLPPHRVQLSRRPPPSIAIRDNPGGISAGALI